MRVTRSQLRRLINEAISEVRGSDPEEFLYTFNVLDRARELYNAAEELQGEMLDDAPEPGSGAPGLKEMADVIKAISKFQVALEGGPYDPDRGRLTDLSAYDPSRF